MKRVYLEITNACNLNCPFCTYEKGNRFLSLKQIDDYTSQIKKYCNYIYLHILGEPLLHPDFDSILDILDKKDFNLQLVTNGTLLYKYPNILNHKCIRKLSISIHSINNIDVNEDYFNNINKLIEINNNKNIELRFYNVSNLDNKLANYLNDLKNKYGFTITSKTNSYKLKDNIYIYFEDLFRWPNINDPFISNIGKCRGAIDMIAINSNCDVTLCCLDPNAFNSIGNLKKNTLDEIINSDLYKKYCNDIKNGKLTSDLCARCTYRLRF
jgi:organic radical activating enzyme